MNSLPDDPRQASAAVVALLDLIEKPSVVTDRAGRIFGSNSAFQAFAPDIESSEPAEFTALLTPAATQTLAAWWQQPANGRLSPLPFRDGSLRALRLTLLEQAGDNGLALIVIEELAASQARSLATPAAAVLRRHDLAAPLTAILGTAEVLLSRGAEMPRALREGLGEIVEQCARISALLTTSAEPEGSRSSAGSAP